MIFRNRTYQIVVVTLFVLALFAPLVQKATGVVNMGSIRLRERREPHPFPDLSKTPFSKWPAELGAYYQDNFGFRKLLIKTGNSIRYHLFGISPSSRVLVGRDGWLFHGSRRRVRFAQGLDHFSAEELEQIHRVYSERHQFLSARGIHYLILVVPSKSTIYPEYYSPRYPKLREQTRFDQALQYLEQHGEVPILYLRDALLERKETSDELLYSPSDHHWNQLGAYTGYLELITRLQEWYPGMKPVPLDQYRLVQKREREGLGQMLGVFKPPQSLLPIFEPLVQDTEYEQARRRYSELRRLRRLQAELTQPSPSLVVRYADSEQQRIPKVIVYRNSFFARMMRFVAQHFQEAEYFTRRESVGRKGEPDFDFEHIDRERPSIVIEQFTDNGFQLPQLEQRGRESTGIAPSPTR